MTRYQNETEARADGFDIAHDLEGHRFVLTKDGAAIGEAHYSLLADDAIDFDHTVVSPEFRGTGLSGLLAEHALTDDIVTGRRVQASCWFIEEYLAKHPHLVAE